MDSTMEKSFYGREEAKMMAGIALVMMLVHHFFGFPDYRLEENYFYEPLQMGGVSLERIFAGAGKLCVAIFAFTSGYAIWRNRFKYNSIKSVTQRGLRFLVNYWVIAGIFLLYALLIGDELPSGKMFFRNLFGGATAPGYPYVNVVFAWYVCFYIILLAISPVLLRIFSGTSKRRDVLLLAFFQLLYWGARVSGLSGRMSSFPMDAVLGTLVVSVLGILVSKWNIFEQGGAIIKHFSKIACFVLAGTTLMIRQIVLLMNVNVGGLPEAVFAGIFIFLCLLFIRELKSRRLKMMLTWIGVYSMNLWFLHGIFFTGSCPLQWILYYPRVSLLILIWGLVLLMPVAVGCAWIQKRVMAAVIGLPKTIISRTE